MRVRVAGREAGAEVVDDAGRTAQPDGRDARAAVPEPGPRRVPAGAAEQGVVGDRHVVEVDVGAVAAGHADGLPRALDGPNARPAQRYVGDAAAVRGEGDDEGTVQVVRTGAEPHPAVQPPGARPPVQNRAGAARAGRPHAVGGAGLGGAPGVGEDGERVGVALGEAGEGEVGATPARQVRPPVQRRAATGQG